jgi:hypothetical protein
MNRWSLARAAFYGLGLSLVVFAVHVLSMLMGTRPYDPWLTAWEPYPAEFLAHWVGYFAAAPALFVAVALVRNLFVRRTPPAA